MSSDFEPAYLKLVSSGELARRVGRAYHRLRACDICPRRCGGDRLGEPRKATCQTGESATVASFGPHLGEENPLRGYYGSGTIFFSWCNLRCVFCQNADISQLGAGQPVSTPRLASMMVELQAEGCHNINLVSPSHVVPQILAALLLAAQAGLRIPLVYNTGGYDAVDTLALLDGVVDIYMPDIKYADPATAQRLSGIRDYPAVNQRAVLEMHRQVGDLVLDARGIARRGLLVRHLVLPDNLAGTARVVEFLAKEISRNTYLNLMDQYRPCHLVGRDSRYSELNRRISRDEYRGAVALAHQAGLLRLDRRA